jgi:hypothetical protein
MGARPYDPSLGRFLSVDPVDGGSLNNYDYAHQDPVNNFDLTGTVCGPGHDGGWKERAVPDGVYTDACQYHDDCYAGKYGAAVTKKACDDEFLKRMQHDCASHFGGWSLLIPGDPLVYGACMDGAQAYYEAVRRLGKGTFDSSRSKSAICQSMGQAECQVWLKEING